MSKAPNLETIILREERRTTYPPLNQTRSFSTGATRDSDNGKLDYEGFLSPLVLERYAQYMHKNRLQSNGELRDGDNWQKGIPAGVYMKSAWRHFMEWWTLHRYGKSYTSMEEISRLDAMEEALCALLFNVQGYLFELIKKRKENANRPKSSSLGA